MCAGCDRRNWRLPGLVAVALVLAATVPAALAQTMVSTADPKATVVSGQARFTILTPRLTIGSINGVSAAAVNGTPAIRHRGRRSEEPPRRPARQAQKPALGRLRGVAD
jgi:hypothetical protein